MDDLEAQALHSSDQLGTSKWSAYAAAEAVDLVAELGLALDRLYLDEAWAWRAVFDKPGGEPVDLALPEATRRMRAGLTVHGSSPRAWSTAALERLEESTATLLGLRVLVDPTVPPDTLELRDGDRVLERIRFGPTRQEMRGYLTDEANRRRKWWQRLLGLGKPRVPGADE